MTTVDESLVRAWIEEGLDVVASMEDVEMCTGATLDDAATFVFVGGEQFVVTVRRMPSTENAG